MTKKELEKLLGEPIGPKVEMVLVGERLFHRESDGTFYEYPPPPPVRDET